MKAIAQKTRRRVFEGEGYSVKLITLLNWDEAEAPLTPRMKQIQAAVLALKELTEIAAGNNREHKTLTLDFPVSGLDQDLMKRIKRLREITRKAIGGVVKVFFDLHVIHPNGRAEISYSTVPARHRRRGVAPFLEESLTKDLVNLASSGRLWSVRQCVHCKRWFFAKFSHHTSCPKEPGKTSCQQKHHRSSEEYKEERRTKARKLYWLHKNAPIVSLRDKATTAAARRKL